MAPRVSRSFEPKILSLLRPASRGRTASSCLKCRRRRRPVSTAAFL